MEAVAAKLLAGAGTTLALFWDSLFGLIFGFLISAIVQVAFSRATMYRLLGPNVRGVANGTVFGIVASACSYGAAAAARGFFQKGGDLRAVFAFMISSTNMNLAILVMFWAMLGWKFAFAEFAGGLVIIAIVSLGVTALFSADELRGLAAAMPRAPKPAKVSECLQCGMEGDDEHAVEHEGTTYLFCGARHEREFREHPARVLGEAEAEAEAEADAKPRGVAALRRRETWREIVEVALGDVQMLKGELLVGFVVAGFAAALVPAQWLGGALHAVGGVPWIGYPLLLLTGLGLAVVTFVCSMGNVPLARYLAGVGIPLGANTTFIYGDLLIPPLVAIYRKSFPPKAVWAFLGLFVFGACAAGALMDWLITTFFGGVTSMPMSMNASDTFTIVANVLGIVAVVAVIVAARGGSARAAVAAGVLGLVVLGSTSPARANDYVNVMLAFDARAAHDGLQPAAGWDSVQLQEAPPWALVRARQAAGSRTALLLRNRDATWSVLFSGSSEPSAAQVAAAGPHGKRLRTLLAQCTPTPRNTMLRARTPGKALELTGMTKVRGRLTFAGTSLRGVAFSCP